MAVKKNKEKAKSTSTKETNEKSDDNSVSGAKAMSTESTKKEQKEISADDKYNELNDRFFEVVCRI
jgi:hypothetical protein